MPIHCEIDHQAVPSRTVSCRSMNFGQVIPTLRSLPYVLRVDLLTVQQLLATQYQQAIEELLADEPANDTEFEAINALRAAGWPSLAEVCRTRPDILELYLRFFDIDVLSLLLGPHAAVGEYQLNSLDSVRVRADAVELEGIAYATGNAQQPPGSSALSG